MTPKTFAVILDGFPSIYPESLSLKVLGTQLLSLKLLMKFDKQFRFQNHLSYPNVRAALLSKSGFRISYFLILKSTKLSS